MKKIGLIIDLIITTMLLVASVFYVSSEMLGIYLVMLAIWLKIQG